MNRVIATISKINQQINDRLESGIVTQTALDDLHRKLDMALDEYVKFHQLKSLATTEGILTLEEGMTIYGYLGESLETFNDQPLAIKTVLTKIYSEMLEKAIKSLKQRS